MQQISYVTRPTRTVPYYKRDLDEATEKDDDLSEQDIQQKIKSVIDGLDLDKRASQIFFRTRVSSEDIVENLRISNNANPIKKLCRNTQARL